MRVGGAYLTVRDSFISDALSECLPPSVQVLLIFVLDYLAPVPLRPPRVQPRRRPFEQHIYHAAHQFCSVPVGGGWRGFCFIWKTQRSAQSQAGCLETGSPSCK